MPFQRGRGESYFTIRSLERGQIFWQSGRERNEEASERVRRPSPSMTLVRQRTGMQDGDPFRVTRIHTHIRIVSLTYTLQK